MGSSFFFAAATTAASYRMSPSRAVDLRCGTIGLVITATPFALSILYGGRSVCRFNRFAGEEKWSAGTRRARYKLTSKSLRGKLPWSPLSSSSSSSSSYILSLLHLIVVVVVRLFSSSSFSSSYSVDESRVESGRAERSGRRKETVR